MPPASPDPKLIVFDKDGVLLDLNATWLPMIVGIAEYLTNKANNTVRRDELLAAVGVEMQPSAETNTHKGKILENSIFAAGTFASMQEAWLAMAPQLKPVFDNPETLRTDMQRIRNQRATTIAKGDIAREMARLRAGGWRLGVATNDGVHSTRLNLEDMRVSEAFDVIICADSGFGRKPEADGLLEACRATGCTPAEAIMVGDTHTDWLAAHHAEYGRFVAIADSAPQLPDFIPSADLVLASVEGLGEALRDMHE